MLVYKRLIIEIKHLPSFCIISYIVLSIMQEDANLLMDCYWETFERVNFCRSVGREHFTEC